MKLKTNFLCLICFAFLATTGLTGQEKEWISLFNGKNLYGWKVGENTATFSVVDGTIKVSGPKAHLFYVGVSKRAPVYEFRI